MKSFLGNLNIHSAIFSGYTDGRCCCLCGFMNIQKSDCSKSMRACSCARLISTEWASLDDIVFAHGEECCIRMKWYSLHWVIDPVCLYSVLFESSFNLTSGFILEIKNTCFVGVIRELAQYRIKRIFAVICLKKYRSFTPKILVNLKISSHWHKVIAFLLWS